MAGLILSMEPDDFWMLAAFLLALTFGGFYFAFKFLIRKRLIEDTPTSKIRSASQGYVELAGHGEMMEDEPISSPLTNTRCLWYDYKVEEHRGSGKNSRWVTIDSGTSTEIFRLIDNTAECVILPDGAEVTPGGKRTWYGSSSTPPSPPAFTDSNSWFGLYFGVRHYRFTEKVLFDTAPLYAIGLFKSIGGAGGSYDKKGDVRELLREWKQDSAKLLQRFDFNEDGEIDMDEWQAVMDAALREVEKQHGDQRTLPAIHTMIETHDKRRPYMLSAYSQEDLLKRYHGFAVLGIIAFLTAGPLVTWMLIVRLAFSS